MSLDLQTFFSIMSVVPWDIRCRVSGEISSLSFYRRSVLSPRICFKIAIGDLIWRVR